MTLVFAILAGFLLGLFIGLAFWHRSRVRITALEKERAADADKAGWTDNVGTQMRDSFAALASDALHANSLTLTQQATLQLEGLIKPLKDDVRFLDEHVRELDKNREGSYKALEQQLTDLGQVHGRLQETTIALIQALKAPTVRGRWGELQLRRVVEIAGMVKHVDFCEQPALENGRPDMIAHLPNAGILAIDSKAPLKFYLEAMEATDDDVRRIKLEQHARAMRKRVKDLGQKQYWDQFDRAPDFVVMFVPNEACLGAAYEHDPGLLEYAFERRVLISSPVNLLALLKTVAYGWQQHEVAANAVSIAQVGRELYRRIERFVAQLADVGKHLDKAVERN